MGYKGFGDDLGKWYITKSECGRWYVCPPYRDGHERRRGAAFTTGAEAIAAFAAGGAE